ncbi:MAG: peptide chain release factor N(5)-glutamine methyltransferase [Putridiphycobacter sp.]|nr:peptide chain release factor N(5)-glutamine methyltransferase [Putridiphycobacter sp.]
MFTKSNLLKDLLPYYHKKLGEIYDAHEIEQMFFLMAFFLFKAEKIEVRTTEIRLTESELLTQRKIVSQLQTGEPIQYILGKVEFYDLVLNVNPSVLIPRPETAELVDLVLNRHTESSLNIIDIGTGSGCIPIALKGNRPSWHVSGIDVSDQALAVARKNAQLHNVDITWVSKNILASDQLIAERSDIIISNPPYVLESDKSLMSNSVLNYEPHLALFVSDQQPLLFYDKIIELSKNQLNSDGYLYFEIHESYGAAVDRCMRAAGFRNVSVIKDLQNKDRFVFGQLS